MYHRSTAISQTQKLVLTGPGTTSDNNEAAAASSSSSSSSSQVSYAAERVIDNGSFGVVFQAIVVETGEVVAIKKVLLDRRFRNRELKVQKMNCARYTIPINTRTKSSQ